MMLYKIQNRKIKVCPVILRNSGKNQEILVFRHPLAGVQLVKGTVEVNESLPEAALRELREESGIINAKVIKISDSWESRYEDQTWFFMICETSEPLPDNWLHFTKDDGGLEFSFFWHPLNAEPDSDWHQVYIRALNVIKHHI